jgi:transcription antitermination protein NusB
MRLYCLIVNAKRRKVRELGMQVLFVWDANGAMDEALAQRVIAEDGADDPHVAAEAMEMARGTWSQKETIDQKLEFHAPHWPPRRQPGVDRSILRLAVWELTNQATPPKVVLDEAIELAKHFSTEQSPSFINAVLDAILKEHQALTKE